MKVRRLSTYPILLGLLLCGSIANASDFVTSGNITLTRIHTNQHGQVAVRGYTAFQLSVALQSRCKYLVIAPDDKATLAHFIAAQTMQKPITVGYSDAVVPLWGDTESCYVTSIDR
jgi:hypothetical protein